MDKPALHTNEAIDDTLRRTRVDSGWLYILHYGPFPPYMQFVPDAPEPLNQAPAKAFHTGRCSVEEAIDRVRGDAQGTYKRDKRVLITKDCISETDAEPASEVPLPPAAVRAPSPQEMPGRAPAGAFSTVAAAERERERIIEKARLQLIENSRGAYATKPEFTVRKDDL